MASKKSGRAAGLAALAGLAYMATRDKGGKEAPSDSSYDTLERKRMPAKAEDATESGDFMSRRLNRIDTDDGKAYSTNNLSPMSSGKSAPASAASAAPAKAPSAATPSGAYRGMRSDMKSVGGGRSGGRGGAEAGEEAAYKANIGDGGKSMVDRQNAAAARATRSMVPTGGKPIAVNDYYDSGKAQRDKEQGTFKYGGAVKKMASGGMTSSASKRGDGIASKGKTRCKMY